MLAQLEMLEAEERSVSQELAETEGEAGNIEDENQQLRAQLRLMDREKVSNSASDPYSTEFGSRSSQKSQSGSRRP